MQIYCLSIWSCNKRQLFIKVVRVKGFIPLTPALSRKGRGRKIFFLKVNTRICEAVRGSAWRGDGGYISICVITERNHPSIWQGLLRYTACKVVNEADTSAQWVCNAGDLV